MSKIDDLYNQIIMEKINAVIEAIKTGKSLDEEMHINIVEMRKIREMLIQRNFKNNKDFIYDHDTYDDYEGEPWFLAINDKNGAICFHENHGTYFSNHEIIDNFGEEFLEQILKMKQIDIKEIASYTKGINESVDEYKKKEIEAKENLVRAKLIATIKDAQEGNKQSRDNSLNQDNEIYTLLLMLEKAGLENGVDYSFEQQPFDYNSTVPELNIRIGDNILNFSGMNGVTSVESIEQIKGYIDDKEEYVDDEYGDDEEEYGESIYSKLLNLKPINLAKLGIDIVLETPEIEEAIKSKEEINLIDLVYDLNEHKVIEYDENEIDVDYVNVAGLSSVIYHAIRGELIDTTVNAQYNEYDNYYTAGEYSDMPGEEEIAKILNSIDRKVLTEYFNKYPEDIELFEEMRSKYDDIKALDEEIEIEEQHDIDDEYEEEYDDYDYSHINTEPSDELVIYNILRNNIPDYRANQMFGENDNFCEIGQYEDMPGEEEIARILNSMSRETLKKYFERHPEDISLFDDVKEIYPEVQPIEEGELPKSPRQLFEESLLREDVVEYYKAKTPQELEERFGPEVARMVGFEQKNSHHCYDLWEHTLNTVDSVNTYNLTLDQAKKLRVAAFFHDIGKPDVAKFNEKTGQQVFYGHANHSVDVAKPILEKLGYSEKEIEELGFYIGHHDDFISYKSQIAPWMKNHEFIRGIDSNTVAEKIIENQYNFEEMGYDKDQIRYICYALGHDGEEPVFMTQDGPMNIKVDMAEVQEKIDSGDYDAKYVPSEEDYMLLLQLCKADASAQSEVAMQQGKQVGSKKEKLENMDNIQNSIPEAFKSIVEKITGYTFEQFIKDSVPQSYGEKRPMVICKDGTECSIQASSFHACSPQKDGLEAYEEFEIGAIAEGITGDLEKYLNYDGVAGNVPKEVIEEIIKAHGGLDKKIMKQRVKAQKEVYKPKSDAYEQMVKEASGGNEYLEKMIRYATRRVEIREQNEKAEKLEEEYKGQLPKEQQTINDED